MQVDECATVDSIPDSLTTFWPIFASFFSFDDLPLNIFWNETYNFAGNN